VSKCGERFVPPASASGAFEHHYVGGYSTLREAAPESHAALRARTKRVAIAYQTLVAARATERLPQSGNPAALALVAAEYGSYAMHAPFNTRELKFGVGLTPLPRGD
jgi:hypothetical protein